MSSTRLRPYVVIEKTVGETPLQALERYRATQPYLVGVPMAYAGRLDPMASGALLILIGEECKQQTNYHQLDKAYTFSVILGIGSDTYDPLGRLTLKPPPQVDKAKLHQSIHELTGTITLPYPPFSSKPVRGKPLHIWALEERLDEISLPKKTTQIYQLALLDQELVSGRALAQAARSRINAVVPVTEPSKELGADFRRTAVLRDWADLEQQYASTQFPVLHLHCICSSGTYMRALAHQIGQSLHTVALATNIHRHTIGRYKQLWGHWGVWTTRFR